MMGSIILQSEVQSYLGSIIPRFNLVGSIMSRFNQPGFSEPRFNEPGFNEPVTIFLVGGGGTKITVRVSFAVQ